MPVLPLPGFNRNEPTAVGRAIVTAVDAAAARSAIGVGTLAAVAKSGNFDATPGQAYLVSLATGHVIATPQATLGTCSIVVVEAGSTSEGSGSGSGPGGSGTVTHELQLLGTAVVLSDGGQRVDIQSDGTNVVYQIVSGGGS